MPISGSALITVEDYPVFGPNAPHNPPACGMAYSSLDLNRVTALQGMTMDMCGACLEVCGAAGCGHVMVVDRGGMGLDLSTGISKSIIGNDDGRGWATWNQVDGGHCAGVWNGLSYWQTVGGLKRVNHTGAAHTTATGGYAHGTATGVYATPPAFTGRAVGRKTSAMFALTVCLAVSTMLL